MMLEVLYIHPSYNSDLDPGHHIQSSLKGNKKGHSVCTVSFCIFCIIITSDDQ